MKVLIQGNFLKTVCLEADCVLIGLKSGHWRTIDLCHIFRLFAFFMSVVSAFAKPNAVINDRLYFRQDAVLRSFFYILQLSLLSNSMVFASSSVYFPKLFSNKTIQIYLQSKPLFHFAVRRCCFQSQALLF